MFQIDPQSCQNTLLKSILSFCEQPN